MPKHAKKSLSYVSRLVVATLSLTGLGFFANLTPEEPAMAATDLVLETVTNDRAVLGSLASRSLRKTMEKSGSAAPYTYTGTDSTTDETYQFQSDRNYTSTANLRESDERAGNQAGGKLADYDSATNQTFQGKTGVLKMENYGRVLSGNTFDGVTTYASHFGPDVFTEPFYGGTSQSVNFSWWAAGAGDEYEIYAFLVALDGVTEANCTAASQSSNYGTNSDYTVLAHGRGKSSSAWTLASNTLPSEGCYRVRFVHGTYDASGGYVVGATFYVAEFQLGLGQSLTFEQPSDLIRNSAAQTFTPTITSNAPGATITLASTTTSVCTVSGTTVTVLAGKTGTCTLRADSAAVGSYGAASSVFRSFTIRTSATKPVSNGGDLVTGTRTICNALTAQLGSWGDGGDAITSTSYQWNRDGVAISGATSASYTLTAADSGEPISFTVTRTNSIGSTSADSNEVTVQDLRMSAIDVGGGTLSPAFDGCIFAYSTSVGSPTITITPTLYEASQTLKVSSSTVVSGQPSQQLNLNVGANTVSVVVSNGALSATTVLSIEYTPDPLVSVLAPTDLTTTTATLNGRGTANSGSNVQADFLWYASDASSSPTVEAATPATGTGYSSADYTLAKTGLSGGTTYYYSFRMGSEESEIMSFTTPNAPIVVTATASDIAKTAATISANINANTDATSVSFQIATSSALVFTNPTTVDVEGSVTGSTDTSSSAEVTGLLPGTTYYFRAVGTNSIGTNYGSVESFTTLPDAPVVTASAATSVAASSAVLPGTVNAQGADTTNIVLKYSTDSGLSGATSVTPTPSAAFGTIERNLEYRISGLTQNTTYYFRYEATNSVGTGTSSIVSFTTQAAPQPTLGGDSSASTSGQINLAITFSETVTGLSTSGIALAGDTEGWTLGDISGSGVSYTLVLTPDPLVAAAGTVQVRVNAGAAVAGARSSLASGWHSVTVTLGISAPDISYSDTAYEFFVGDAIDVGTPTNAGGNFASIGISPATTSGIAFSGSTGEVSGTATEVLTETVFTVTATNPAGSGSVTFSVVIAPRPQASGPATPPAYSGPSPQIFIPRIIEENAAYVIQVKGSRLQQVTGMSHGSITLKFKIISNDLIEVEIPPLPQGVKQITFTYGGGGIVSYLNALIVRPAGPGVEPPNRDLVIESDPQPDSGADDEQVTAPSTPESSAGAGDSSAPTQGDSTGSVDQSDGVSTSSPEVEQPAQVVSLETVWGFVPGRATLDVFGARNLATAVEKMSAATQISCVGFTMGPTVLSVDIQLSYERANNVCNAIKRSLPNVEIIRLEGRQDLRVGNEVRRVEIEWR